MKIETNWQWRTFNQLSPKEMASMFALRQDVFIVEQDCVFQDIDGKDEVAHHLLGWQGEQLVATLRVFEHYQQYQQRVSIGRICSHLSVRNSGIGQELVQKAIDFIAEKFPNPIQIGAQFYLKSFYQQFDFKQISEIYDEDGIDHIHMLRD